MWTNAHSPSFPDATAVDLDSIFWSRYSRCINQSFPGSPNDKAEKAKMAQTVWMGESYGEYKARQQGYEVRVGPKDLSHWM